MQFIKRKKGGENKANKQALASQMIPETLFCIKETDALELFILAVCCPIFLYFLFQNESRASKQ